MPALAVADTSHPVNPTQGSLPAPNRDPLNFYLRPPAPRGQRSPSDAFFNHTLYDNSTASLFIPPHSHPAYFERVYQPPSNQVSPPAPNTHPPSMFSYFALPPLGSTGSWQTHVSMIQHNSYLPQSLPPSQPAHKVWLLDCKSCGAFLTNRGMKAVLLLRPNVSLFSTDALPINCSAYATNPDALRPPPCRPPTVLRTCECLTQTLCCHTCGAAVGYMIVIPCSRCTSSTTATNRATNGHRFVFHSSEIIASERYYIPDEAGIIPIEYATPPVAPPPLTPVFPAQSSLDGPVGHRPILHPFPSQISPSPSESMPTSLSEYGDIGPGFFPSSSDAYMFTTSTSARRSPRPLPRSPSPHTSASQLMRSSSQPGTGLGESTPESRGVLAEFRDPPGRKLKAGDVLYWHHLAKNGEIPGVQEDPRARMPKQNSGIKYLDR